MTRQQVKVVLVKSAKYQVMHVDVDKTVEAIKLALNRSDQVSINAKQSQISRIGMIMKRVEEETKCNIVSMKTGNEIEKANEDNNKESAKNVRVLYFEVVFAKQGLSQADAFRQL